MEDKGCTLVRGRGNPNLFRHPLVELMVDTVGEYSLKPYYYDVLSGQLFQLAEGISSEHPNGVWRALKEWPERVMRNSVQAYGPVPFRG